MTILEDVNKQLEHTDPIVQAASNMSIVLSLRDCLCVRTKDNRHDMYNVPLEVNDVCLYFNSVKGYIGVCYIEKFTNKKVTIRVYSGAGGTSSVDSSNIIKLFPEQIEHMIKR